MPYTTTETALVTMAAALVVQTVLVVGVAIAAAVVTRRLERTLKAESAALQLRLDEALAHVQTAAESVSRLSHDAGGVAHQAGRVIDDVGGAVRAVATTVAAPRTLLAAGAAAGLRALLRRWPLMRGAR